MGNLRMDIGNSAATLDKASKKKAIDLSKKFYAKVLPPAHERCDRTVLYMLAGCLHTISTPEPLAVAVSCRFYMAVSVSSGVVFVGGRP